MELDSWHMDDANIGEGRKETTVFRKEQIEKMGEWRFQNKSCCKFLTSIVAKIEDSCGIFD